MTEVQAASSGACSDPIEALLPWYVTQTLDAEDHAAVEAHLAICSACRLALGEEQVLRDAIVELPLESDLAWHRFKQAKFDAPPRRSMQRWLLDAVVKRPGRAAGLAAMQAAVIVLVFGIATSNPFMSDEYRGLSSATFNAPNGNALVVFRPDTTEAELRRLLAGSQATIVGGPTATNGYILQMPQRARAKRIAALRGERAILLVHAIDGPVL